MRNYFPKNIDDIASDERGLKENKPMSDWNITIFLLYKI